MVMPHIDYPQFIEESEGELRKLEKRHRYGHLFHRVRMLGLLKSEEYSTIEEAAKRGEIATIAQAHEFLAQRGIGYSHSESAGGLLRRRKVKLKTGRPIHEKADQKAQEAVKKVP